MMVDPCKIKIDNVWTGHAKFIRYNGREVGYITGGAGQWEARSTVTRRKTPVRGWAAKGHEASMLIAACDMIRQLLDRAYIHEDGTDKRNDNTVDYSARDLAGVDEYTI